jgi:2-dehydropantoate 2-reductase
MNFLVIGPGAMGCLFGAKLKKAGHDVILLDYRPERAKVINTQGIRVEDASGVYAVRVRSVTGDVPFTPDVVLVCVKAANTRNAAKRLPSQVGQETRILTLQNGLGNVETLIEIFGAEKVLGGVTAEGATVLGPGHIKHAGRGETAIGPSAGPGGIVAKIVQAFGEAGFSARSVDKVDDLIWGKLLINVGINALTAITRLKNGRLPEFHGTRTLMEMAVSEAERVARAKGIELPYSDTLGRVLEVCKATSGNIASMLQDVLSQRTTEVDFINGAIVREGEALGIPTPVNRTLTCLVQTIQETYLERLIAS